MKRRGNSGDDFVIPNEMWECFDDCPICRALKKAAEEGRELSQDEIEKAIDEAEMQD